MKVKDFYIHLGKLLYSVAMADGKVQDEEIQALHNMVVRELSDEALFDIEEDNVFHTEFEFEALMDKNVNRQEAFNSFLNYFDENHGDFSDHMKKTTVLAVEQIAKSFDGIVPEEREMIDLLKERLKLI